MVGILLVSHSELCVGMKKSCEMIAGDQSDMYTISLSEEGVDDFRKNLSEMISTLEKQYEKVFLVTDIPNATPYNECYRYILSNKSSSILLSGMNLTLVLELCIMKDTMEDSEALARQVMESGKISIQKLNLN